MHIFIYIYIYIILCLLDKHDKCNVSKLAVTIKIQYLCVLKVHRIKTAKKRKKKENKTEQKHPKVVHREVQIYSTNLFYSKNSTNKNATK